MARGTRRPILVERHGAGANERLARELFFTDLVAHCGQRSGAVEVLFEPRLNHRPHGLFVSGRFGQ
jgi:hypothetical protein